MARDRYQGSNIGIPYVVIGGTQIQVNVGFTAYGDESDPGPMPITSFTATPSSVGSGNSVTLSWDVSNAAYLIVSPQAGPVGGTSVSLSPTQTTTYTLYATNQYGRSMATVTVNVQ